MQAPRFLIVILLLLLPFVLMAQPGNPNQDADVPITGIEYLLTGGMLLGLRRIFQKKK